MNFWFAVFRQAGRNLRQTWPSQFMTLLTVSLSVLIFAFFFLIYNNMLRVGDKLGDDLLLIVYLEEEPGPEMQEQQRKKILPLTMWQRFDLFPGQKHSRDFPTSSAKTVTSLRICPRIFSRPQSKSCAEKPQEPQSAQTVFRLSRQASGG